MIFNEPAAAGFRPFSLSLFLFVLEKHRSRVSEIKQRAYNLTSVRKRFEPICMGGGAALFENRCLSRRGRGSFPPASSNTKKERER